MVGRIPVRVSSTSSRFKLALSLINCIGVLQRRIAAAKRHFDLAPGYITIETCVSTPGSRNARVHYTSIFNTREDENDIVVMERTKLPIWNWACITVGNVEDLNCQISKCGNIQSTKSTRNS